MVVYPEPQKLLEVFSTSLPELVLAKIVEKVNENVTGGRPQQATLEEVE